jgi:hypothetical protein
MTVRHQSGSPLLLGFGWTEGARVGSGVPELREAFGANLLNIPEHEATCASSVTSAFSAHWA